VGGGDETRRQWNRSDVKWKPREQKRREGREGGERRNRREYERREGKRRECMGKERGSEGQG
jgi:hypothetical protein